MARAEKPQKVFSNRVLHALQGRNVKIFTASHAREIASITKEKFRGKILAATAPFCATLNYQTQSLTYKFFTVKYYLRVQSLKYNFTPFLMEIFINR